MPKHFPEMYESFLNGRDSSRKWSGVQVLEKAYSKPAKSSDSIIGFT